MPDTIASLAGVCEVEYVRGRAADPGVAPDLLLEVPHGATRTDDYAALRRILGPDIAADLQDFFFVNTDTGAPELARRVAERVVATQPRRTALVVRSTIPRTFIDCNRVIDRGAVPQGSASGEVTPGLPPWIRAEPDRSLLLDRYFAYRDLVTRAFAQVCGRGGLGLMVHTYAPRSIDVPVDDDIVDGLRAEYAADRIGSWPLRAAVDLITHDPDGRELASMQLAARARAEFAAAGFEVVLNGAYSLHPATLAHTFAERYPGTTLCLEVRRDLLVTEFVPFRAMRVDAAKVDRAAAPLSAAIMTTV